MTTVYLAPGAFGAGGQFFTLAGLPLNQGTIYTYSAGTTTPLATYTTSAGNVQNANPIVLDVDGRPPNEIWITSDSYRFDLKDSLGNLIKTYDNLVAPDITAAQLAASSGSSLVSFIQSGTGAVADTVQTELRYIVRPEQFGAVRNGTTDDSAAFVAAQAAISATGGEIRLSRGKYAVNLTLTTPNIRLAGETQGADRTGTPGIDDCSLVPFNTANPVIQVANDSAIVSGISLENIGIYGAGTGTTGLKLAGGCRKNIFRNIAINGFTTDGISILVGSTYSPSYNTLDGIHIECPASCTSGFHITGSSAIGAQANFLTNFSISAPGTAGFAMIVDSADLNAGFGWIQASDGHGIQFKNSNTYAPSLQGGPVTVDSSASTDVLVQNDFSTSLVSTDYLRGIFLVDGLMANSAAATASLVNKRAYSYQPYSYQPYSVLNHYFVNTANPDLTNVSISVGTGAAPRMTLIAGGGITLQPDAVAGNGIITANAVIDCTAATPRLRMSGTQVMTTRKTGWTAATGTATRTTFATYAGQTVSNPPTQAQVQAIDDNLVIINQHLKALLDDLISHGMIGA